MLFHDSARIGYFYTEKTVSFSVLARSGLEKAGKDLGLFGIGDSSQIGLDRMDVRYHIKNSAWKRWNFGFLGK